VFIFFSIIFFSGNYAVFPGNHALYLSVVEVAHVKNESQASVKIKVFTNDMEDAIRNELHKGISLSDTSSFHSQKEILEKYFSNHFLLSINGKEVDLSMTGSKLVGDAIWFYFKMNCQSKWDNVSVKADYLMELFPTQSNVVSIEHDENKRFIRLTNTKKKDTIKF